MGLRLLLQGLLGYSDVSVSNKLNNNVDWGQEEIENAVNALEIPPNEIHSYFLLEKLRKLNK